MKSAFINLLIVAGLIACGLNAAQWWREARLHERLDDLDKQNYEQAVAIQGVELSLKRMRDEVTRVGIIREGLTVTNEAMGIELTQTRAALEASRDSAAKAEAAAAEAKQQYEAGSQELAELNRKILAQAEQVKGANDQRTQEVQKFNDVAKDYNQLATRYKELEKTYNDLVAQVKAATGQ